jgi:ABC transporter substrate binding protein
MSLFLAHLRQRRQTRGPLAASDAGDRISLPDIVLEVLIRQAASYLDRIIKGTAPGDLPVQQSTRLQFVIDLKTAKALGLDLPPSLLAQADDGIE